MNPLTKTLTCIVIIVHLLFFILETILWNNPLVYNLLIDLLNNPVNTDHHTQALILKNLFINQGFYNLFLVSGGLAGFYHIKKGNYSAGYALILFLCFAGIGAGIVLACATKAYLFAFCQAVPAGINFARIYPAFKNTLT